METMLVLYSVFRQWLGYSSHYYVHRFIFLLGMHFLRNSDRILQTAVLAGANLETSLEEIKTFQPKITLKKK